MEYNELIELISRKLVIPKEVLELKVQRKIKEQHGFITKKGALWLVILEDFPQYAEELKNYFFSSIALNKEEKE